MEPTLVDISDISDEIKELILTKNSRILNIVLLTIFIFFFIMFTYICWDDKKKYTKNYILRKLLFIKRNT